MKILNAHYDALLVLKSASHPGFVTGSETYLSNLSDTIRRFPEDCELLLRKWRFLCSSGIESDDPQASLEMLSQALDSIRKARAIAPGDRMIAFHLAFTLDRIGRLLPDDESQKARALLLEALIINRAELRKTPNEIDAMTNTVAALDSLCQLLPSIPLSERCEFMKEAIRIRNQTFDVAPTADLATEIIYRFVNLIRISGDGPTRTYAIEFVNRVRKTFPNAANQETVDFMASLPIIVPTSPKLRGSAQHKRFRHWRS